MLKHRARAGSSDEGGIVIPVGDKTGSASGRSRPGRRHGDGSGGFVRLVLTLALMGLSAFGGYAYLKRTKLDGMVASHQRELSAERSVSGDLKSRLAAAESTRARLEAELAAAKKEAADKASSAASQAAEVTKQGDKIKQLVEYKKRIHSAIQQYAKQRLLERFGPGPHRVEIRLAYDPASNVFSLGGGDRVVLEMAPADEMPYTVYWFLSQVDRGLYNDTSFHRNAHHVVQAGPTANFMTPPDSHLVQRFRRAGLDGVVFQEYSPKFPHEKFTVGYAGRPGGPDFYISTMNNVDSHGPGGQSSYADPAEADPCFAKVVEGLDAVERMHKSDVEPGSFMGMKHNVAIQYMRILPKEDVPGEPQKKEAEEEAQ